MDQGALVQRSLVVEGRLKRLYFFRQTAPSRSDGPLTQSKQGAVITRLREVTGNEAHGGFKLRFTGLFDQSLT